MTIQIVHKKIIDDQCIFDVFLCSSSAFWLKGGTDQCIFDVHFYMFTQSLSKYQGFGRKLICYKGISFSTGSKAGAPRAPLVPVRGMNRY